MTRIIIFYIRQPTRTKKSSGKVLTLRTDKTDRQVRRPTGSSRPAENLLIESQERITGTPVHVLTHVLDLVFLLASSVQ